MLVTYYFLTIRLIAAVVVLIMGICLLAVYVPKEAALRNYRISRVLLAIAYIALSTVGLSQAFHLLKPQRGSLLLAITLTIAPLQALLFTSALITLINSRFVTARKIWAQVIPVLICGTMLVLIYFSMSANAFLWACYVALLLYCLQIVLLVTIFMKEYKRYRQKLDNFFSGDEERRTLWVRNIFFMATGVGVMAATIPLFASQTAYLVFIFSYLFLYPFFAIKYINYVNLFHRIAPVVDASEKTNLHNHSENQNISSAIECWINKKGFIQQDITLESLAMELCTNQSYLSRHINAQFGQNFKAWINSLRIAESQRLLDDHHDLSLIEVAERSGIPSNSTFYRNFVTVTGMTPAEYRRQKQSQNEIE